MKLLIDTNVILDVLLERQPYYKNSVEVLKLASRDGLEEYVSASAITDIYYIACRNMHDRAAAREVIKNLLEILSVAAVSEDEIRNAIDLEWDDFEDAVQYSVAMLQNMDGVITRNTKDYHMQGADVFTPEEILSQMS